MRVLKLKPITNFYLSVFFSHFNVFLNIHEYANEISYIIIIGSTSCISTLFGTMFGNPGYIAAEIWVILLVAQL